ncbi:hypothetical protein M3Y96_00635800 [Aphelenchoides besseyi]|nr:hypothetical protein M3Y96_00635800 [Aphelenchoides besseyi]
MISKSLFLVALCFGTASALCTFCNTTTQDQAIQNAQVIAKVLIKSAAKNENGKNTYDAEFEQIFKPQGANNQSFKGVTSDADISCSGLALFQGQTYLIAGKQEGQNVQYSKCESIPLAETGISNGPILWSAVPRALQNKLEQQNGNGQQGQQQGQQGGQQGGQKGGNGQRRK